VEEGGARKLKFIDFGLTMDVVAAFDKTRMTAHNTVLGTYAYNSPEKFKGANQPEDDLWAVAVTMYEMYTGRLPFVADSEEALRMKITSPESVEALDGCTSSTFSNVIMNSLSKDAQQRFKSADDMIQELQRGIYHIFLSYRVNAMESKLTRAVYDNLSKRTFKLPTGGESPINCYLDCMCIRDGEDWRMEFLTGLFNSEIFVPFVTPAVTSRFTKIDPPTNDFADNVLLEYQIALGLEAYGTVRKIFPVLIGAADEASWGSGWTQTLRQDPPISTKQSKVTSQTGSEYLKKTRFPLSADCFQSTAQETLNSIMQHQGVIVEDKLPIKPLDLTALAALIADKLIAILEAPGGKPVVRARTRS